MLHHFEDKKGIQTRRIKERKEKKIEEKKGKEENIYRRKNWTFHFDRCPGRVRVQYGKHGRLCQMLKSWVGYKQKNKHYAQTPLPVLASSRTRYKIAECISPLLWVTLTEVCYRITFGLVAHVWVTFCQLWHPFVAQYLLPISPTSIPYSQVIHPWHRLSP